MAKKQGPYGTYHAVHSALIDDPHFQLLEPDSKTLFFTLRLCHEAGIAGLFRYYRSMMMERSGLTRQRHDDALDELQQSPTLDRQRPWVYYDEETSVIWIRNAVEANPTLNIASNWEQREGVFNQLRAVPKTPLMLLFADYYQLTLPEDLVGRLAEYDDESKSRWTIVRPHRTIVERQIADAAAVAPELHLEAPPATGSARAATMKRRDAERLAIWQRWRRRIIQQSADQDLATYYLDHLEMTVDEHYAITGGTFTPTRKAAVARSLNEASAEAVLGAAELFIDKSPQRSDERWFRAVAKSRDRMSGDEQKKEMQDHRRRHEGRGFFSQTMEDLASGSEAIS